MVLSEPLSPELVLVCPELRERALAALPPLPWEALPARKAETVPATRPLWGALFYATGLVAPLLMLGLGSLLLAVALTLVAGAIR